MHSPIPSHFGLNSSKFICFRCTSDQQQQQIAYKKIQKKKIKRDFKPSQVLGNGFFSAIVSPIRSFLPLLHFALCQRLQRCDCCHRFSPFPELIPSHIFFFCSARRHVWWYSFYLCILCAEVGDVGRSTDAAISCILWRDTNKLREKWKTARERKKLVTKCTADPNTKTGQNSTQEGARRIMQSHVMRSNSWLNGNLHSCFFVVSWQFERKIEWNAINRWIGVAWTKMAGVGWHRTKWRSLFFKKKEMKRRRIYGWI